MKKISLFLLLSILSLPAQAVLNERNLQQSLSVLHIELKNAYLQQKQSLQRYRIMTQAQHAQMLETMKKSSQISLMLFSQKDDYIFDLTYACHEATEQYRQFNEQRMPFTRINNMLTNETERYDGLIQALEMLPPALNRHLPQRVLHDSIHRFLPMKKDSDVPFELDAQGKEDRNKCLLYAKALRNNIVRLSRQIKQDSLNYQMTGQQLSRLNTYAIKRYHDIQQSIFRNNNNASYVNILANFGRYFNYARKDFKDKYSTDGAYKHVNSEWRGPIVWGYILFVLGYLFVSCILSISIINLLMKKWKRMQTPSFQSKKIALILTCGVMIFAMSIMMARVYLTHNFYVMASELLVEYAWLLVAIFASLLIRLNGTQIQSGFRIYTPIVLMGLLIIMMRIVFIPNVIVNLLFFPIVLVFTIGQWRNMKHNMKAVPHSDRFYTGASLAVMAFSVVSAYLGYTLLAVEAFIWWLFQLTAIQTITCTYCLLDRYEDSILKKRLMDYGATHSRLALSAQNGEYITVTWFFDLVHKALVPVAGVYSVLYCIYLAADVFDLSETCISIFLTPFVDVDGVIQLSLFKLVVVTGLFFIFKYLSYALKAFYRHFRLNEIKRKSGKKVVRTNEVNLTLGYNLVTILSWGTFLILATIILRIPKSGISIITAGLATGIGFAMKDLLNNFFYGVSLMAGRLRVGDWIECDGVQGKVDSISYQSTQVITTDDCVMSFLNATLFSKNFKNLTRNHSYELIKIPVGVAYGTDVDKVRKMLIETVMALQSKDKYGRDILEAKRGVSVIFSDFGDNSVDLIVVIRVLVAERVGFIGKAKEAIYNTLTKNQVEIPFPQRDVYIRQIPTQEKKED